MKYRELHKFLHSKPYYYNRVLRKIEDFSSLPLHPFQRFTSNIPIDLVGTNLYVTYYGVRELQAIYQNRKYLKYHMNLAEAKAKYPEHFL